MPYVLGIDVGDETSASVIEYFDGSEGAPHRADLTDDGVGVLPVPRIDSEGALVLTAAEPADPPTLSLAGFLARVGDAVPIVAGGFLVRPEDIVAALVRICVDRVTAERAEAPAAIAVTRPAVWGAYRASLVRSALDAVDLPDALLIDSARASAVAADRSGATTAPSVVVVDLGVSALEVSLFASPSRSGDAAESSVGGAIRRVEHRDRGVAAFDRALVAHVVEGVGLLDPLDPDLRAPLEELRRRCAIARAQLDVDGESTVELVVGGHRERVRIVRAEFEELIESEVAEICEIVAPFLDDAPDTVPVLLAGSGAGIPLIAEMLSARFDRTIIVADDPLGYASSGAALAATERQSPTGAPSTGDRVHDLLPVRTVRTARLDAVLGAIASDASDTVRTRRLRVVRIGSSVAAAVAVTAGAAVVLALAATPGERADGISDASPLSDRQLETLVAAANDGTAPLADLLAPPEGDEAAPPTAAEPTPGARLTPGTKSTPAPSPKSSSKSSDASTDGSRPAAPPPTTTDQTPAPQPTTEPSSDPPPDPVPSDTPPTEPPPSEPDPTPTNEPAPDPSPAPAPEPAPEEPPATDPAPPEQVAASGAAPGSA
ncbi:Hsp70 family protein [Herbiconiux sp. L3-i23]|uniref:Hsp70 family protein n=1 Tax=Herbiconiux sp. L3-i23 TaxID=2905871 RepID=UPI00204D6FD0|nr:Hsp70 family protein [Herbiconiux sp. L3-i23]BDI22347.1 hypothetical protein L3i23_11230 [Herbiconiux sp. L3-i23]